jgi:hypothetical protein
MITTLPVSFLRRSGAHVISDQIAKSFSGNCFLFNDMNIKIPEPQIFSRVGHGVLNLLLYEEKNSSLGLEIIRSVYNVYSSRVKMIERHDNAKRWYGILPIDKKFVERWKGRATSVIENRELSVIYEEWLEDNSVILDPLEEFGIHITQLSAVDKVVTGIPQGSLRHKNFVDADETTKASLGSSFPEKVSKAEEFKSRYKDVELPDYILKDKELQELHTELYGWSLYE